MLNSNRRQHSSLIQLFDLWLIQLSNWRWAWRSVIVVDTAAPLVSLIALGVFARDAGPDALAYVLTGNIVLSLMFGNLDKVSGHMAYLRAVGSLSYFATLPIQRPIFVLATVLAFMVLSLPSLLVTLLVGSLILHVPLAPSPFILIVVPLSAIALSGIGALIGTSARTPQEAGSLTLLTTLVLAGLGAIIIPPERLPGWMLVVRQFSPATYATSALRQTLLGPVTPIIWLDLAALVGIALMVFWLVRIKLTWRQSE
jgi:ABC-2 type transport system permease protein